MNKVKQKKGTRKVTKKVQPAKVTIQKKPYNLNRLFIFLIFLFAIILYGNTVSNRYSIDDHLVTYPNAQIAKGLEGIPEIFSTYYAAEEDLTYGYRPIVKTTFAIEFQLSKWLLKSGPFGWFKPGISHFINLILYALTCLILFRLLKRLFKDSHLLFPFIITMLFLAHPIHTEVIASLKNRDEILSLLFALATVLRVLKFVDTKKPLHIILAVVFFIIAILSKRSAGVFILVIPLVLHFFTEVRRKTIVWIFLASLVILIASVVIPSFFLPGTVRPTMYYENPLFTEDNILIKLGSGLYILLYYFRLIVFPHPLLFYYGYDMIPMVTPANIWAIISFLFHAGLFIFAIYKFKSKNILSFAILFYLFNIAAYSNIIFPSTGIIAERFVYPASIAFCIVLGYFIFKIFKVDPFSKKITNPSITQILIITLVIFIPYSIRTITRNQNWKNKFTLYERDIKYLDRSVKANTIYASLLYEELVKSIRTLDNADLQPLWAELIPKHYNRALELYPDHFKAWNNLGSFYAYTMQEYDKAIQCFEEATRLKPDIPEPLFNIAYIYQTTGNFEEAEKYYLKTLEIKPDYHLVRTYRADLYFNRGDIETAINIVNEIRRIEPDSEIPDLKAGDYYFQSGDTLTAIRYWEQAVEKKPQFEMCKNLSNHYRLLGGKIKDK